MMLLHTARLLLRPLTADDITDTYIDALNDPEVVRFTEARHTQWTKDAVEAYIRDSSREGVSWLLGVFQKDEARHIGNIRLFNIHPLHRRAELGIMMFDKTQWSQGFGAEALRAVVEYAFHVLKLHRIHADYYAANIASARLFEKCGFRVEGVFHDHFWVENAFMNSVRIGRCDAQDECG